MQNRSQMQFQLPFTPLSKKVLIGLLVAYILELILGQTLIPLSSFAWHPGNEFKIWQPITSILVLDIPPFAPMRFLLSLLGIVFFMPPVENMFKQRGLIRIFILSLATSIALGALCMVTSLASVGVSFGLEAFITALLAVFCFANPNASILLFFILPIKAEWIGWFTGLISFLLLIAHHDIGSAVHLAGWIAGLAFLATRRRGPLKKLYQQTIGKPRPAKKPFKFEVLDGGKKDDDTFH